MYRLSGCACSPFQLFLIVLIKLRLKLGDQDFVIGLVAIHQSTVSSSLTNGLIFFITNCLRVVSWPEHEQLLKTLPANFRKHFGNIIIDCFEIFIDTNITYGQSTDLV